MTNALLRELMQPSWTQQLIRNVSHTGRVTNGISAYRWILGCLFLLAAFNQFPEHRAPIALALLFVSQSFYLVAAHATLQNNVALLAAETAERKTRLTVVTTAAWAARRQTYDANEFWSEVDRAVAAEHPPEPDTKLFSNILGAIGTTVWRGVGDVVGIAIVFALSA